MSNQIKLVIAAVSLIFGLIVLAIVNPLTIINAGERGVILEWGAVKDKILSEGIHWVTPISTSIIKVNVKTQTIAFDKEVSLGAASKDLQDVTISAITNFHQNTEKVNDIYQKYGSSYQENIIEPILREVVKSVASQYTAEELVTKRMEVSDKINTILKERFEEKNAILERFNIVNFSFSDSFNQAIEQKVTAEQNALASKNKLEQVKYEASQRVEQAKAEAEAIRIQAQAITQQGGENYVQLQAIQRWNGVLPAQMIPGSTVPFLNLTK